MRAAIACAAAAGLMVGLLWGEVLEAQQEVRQLRVELARR